MFVLAYENEASRSSFSKYYTPFVEIKDYNVLINRQPFFEWPVKNKKKSYKEIVDTSKNLNDYTGSLLDYEYFLNHCKLIAVDLSRQDIDLDKQQINLIGILDENSATVFFIIEKSERTTLKFSQNFVDIV